jgi:hypothetical protein
METSRLAVAAAAAALFLAGCTTQGGAGSGAMQSADAGTVKIKCYGANACKGQAECKTAMNECKGHNACKGKGFLSLTEQDCVNRLGRA